MKLRPDLELVVLIDKRSTGIAGPVACSGCVYYYPPMQGGNPTATCLTMSTKCLSGASLIWKEKVDVEAQA